MLKSRKLRDERMSNSSEIRGFHVGYRDSVATGVDTRPVLRVVLKRVDTAKWQHAGRLASKSHREVALVDAEPRAVPERRGPLVGVTPRT